MKIYFEFELQEKGAYEKCSLEEKTALQEIWNYIYDKTYHLDELIEAEEIENNLCCTMVYFRPEGLTIQPKIYSQFLLDAIVNSFNEADSKKLWESVQQSLFRLLN